MPTNAPTDILQLSRLLQLCSPALPVGGFSFSQGLEYAVDSAWVDSVETCEHWILAVMQNSIAVSDLVIVRETLNAIKADDKTQFVYLNQLSIALRETKELKLGEVAMGQAMLRLLNNQPEANCEWLESLQQAEQVSFACAFALCCERWQINLNNALAGFLWTFLENQIAAATKLVPLGQTQAQNLLFKLSEQILPCVEKSLNTSLHEAGDSMPNQVMAAAKHEQQYSRLFRS